MKAFANRMDVLVLDICMCCMSNGELPLLNGGRRQSDSYRAQAPFFTNVILRIKKKMLADCVADGADFSSGLKCNIFL